MRVITSLGPTTAGCMMNNPMATEDGDPNRWCMEWTVSIIPILKIGYNEDTKDHYRHIMLEWFGIRAGIHIIRPTSLTP